MVENSSFYEDRRPILHPVIEKITSSNIVPLATIIMMDSIFSLSFFAMGVNLRGLEKLETANTSFEIAGAMFGLDLIAAGIYQSRRFYRPSI